MTATMSPQFAILRIAKLKTMGNVAGSLAHTYRTRETPNADPEKIADNEHEQDTPAKVMDALKALLPEKRRKDAVLGIEYFIGASPEWFEGGKDGSDYFRAAVDWLEKRHGKENVVGWSVHRDESTPHLVAYVVPLENGRLNAKKWTGGKVALSKMQTEFARDVGQRFGMSRGIEGSKAHHQTIKGWYAQAEKPGQHVTISPEATKPKVLKKGFLSSEYESPEMVAARLTKAVRQAYAPAVEAAKLAASERRRADEMAETARSKDAALKAALERLELTESALKPVMDLAALSRDEFVELVRLALSKVNRIKQERFEAEKTKQLDHERQHRIDDLVRVERKTAGAACLFARHALDAIKQASGDALLVDWGKVERAAAIESIGEHRQSPQDVFAAIVKHSPGMVDPVQQEKARAMISRMAGMDIAAPSNTPERGRGPSR